MKKQYIKLDKAQCDGNKKYFSLSYVEMEWNEVRNCGLMGENLNIPFVNHKHCNLWAKGEKGPFGLLSEHSSNASFSYGDGQH